MAPPDPKRPPSPEDSQGVELGGLGDEDLTFSDEPLPFEEGEVVPLQADDPRPQRVPQFPAGKRRRASRGARRDRELVARYEPGAASVEPERFLYVERGPGVGQLLPVPSGSLILGRSSASHLRLSHPSISRRHAEITRHGDRFALRDLRSQNGTWVNRKRVRGEVEVFCGDELRLGGAVLRLRGANAPTRPPRAARVRTPRPHGGARRLVALLLVAAALFLALAVLALGSRPPFAPELPAAGGAAAAPRR